MVEFTLAKTPLSAAVCVRAHAATNDQPHFIYCDGILFCILRSPWRVDWVGIYNSISFGNGNMTGTRLCMIQHSNLSSIASSNCKMPMYSIHYRTNRVNILFTYRGANFRRKVNHLRCWGGAGICIIGCWGSTSSAGFNISTMFIMGF